MLESLGNKLRSLAGFRSRATLVSGKVRGSREILRLLYIGNGTNLAFLMRTAFDDDREEKNVGGCNIWSAASIARTHADRADLVAFDVPWPYEISCPADTCVVELPAWIRQKVTLAPTWEDTVARFHKNVRGSQLRKIRKYELTYTTTSSLADVDKFYDEMYVPYTRSRFGVDARIVSRRYARNCVSAGTLLQVLGNGQTIAACLLIRQRAELNMLLNGFSTTDLRSIDGASAAMYYYTLQYGFEKGFDTVNLFGSRPLLDDGVFRTKRSWGAAVFDDWSLESILLSFNRWSSGVHAFLATNPLLTRDYGELTGKVLIDSEPLTAEQAIKIVHRFRCSNLDNLKIFALRGVCDDVPIDSAGATRVHLIDLLENDDPLRVFCDG